MGVYGDDGFIDIWYAFIQARNDCPKFERHGVTDGIGDVNGFGTCVNSSFNNASQIGDRGTACIFAGELHVIGIITRTLNHVDRALNDLIQRTA